MPMPAQKPGRSKQNYATPSNFIEPVKKLLGITEFDCDLAAEPETAKAPVYITKEMDAFSFDSWKFGNGWNWLNPEFADIGPWVDRAFSMCKSEGAQTAVLIPAGVGSNWWRDWVHGKAYVLLLNGRLCFIENWATTIDPATEKPGKGPARFYTSPPLYPKDCCLLLYSPAYAAGYDVWTWATCTWPILV